MKFYATPAALGFLFANLFTMREFSLIPILVGLIWLAIGLEVDFKPIRNWIVQHKERAQRRRQYELFKAGVKSGLYATDDQIADENRRVIQ